MAIITEEPESPQAPKPKISNKPPQNPPSQSTPPNTPNPFTFWFYFTLLVSLTTLLFVSLSTLSPQDPKAWFLSLPTSLRHHYSHGRIIKVQTTPNQPPIEVFTIQNGPVKSDSVVIIHGLGCSSFTFRKIVESLGRKGLHAVAIDLPGSGFSDKSMVVMEESSVSGLGRIWEIYSEIKEKGLFWGFDQLIEQGYVDYEKNEIRISRRESVRAIELGSEEMGRVLGQVIDAMGLAPVDLVLHDSALGLSANWVLENPGLVRSVTLLDTTSSATALPLWVLGIPVVREFVLGFRFVFGRVLELCCSKSVGGLDVEAHRILLKGRDGRRAVVGMGKKLNCSFDLVEWGSSGEVKGLPMQVVWSSGWSKEWSEEGRRVANALPQASFVTHSGGRWPQDDSADEIAQSIFQFLSKLPKSVRQSEEEPIPEHIQKMFDEAKGSDHHHHDHHGHGGHEHDHGHAHTAGYMDAYGLGQGWAS
ncbi:Protein AUXIN RESPONSE like [Actinidia chinensis var. chinensis]|uniref:Protein AUXIN RESPONSE like n=1 Tax=Actinidia chinensis var. chinensis TaxID=1590841 RepID=A0A2R6QL68_ACTCC|nr:Protein AUXIN RESPONSE like [Actinidia chinensis var. chinensis]